MVGNNIITITNNRGPCFGRVKNNKVLLYTFVIVAGCATMTTTRGRNEKKRSAVPSLINRFRAGEEIKEHAINIHRERERRRRLAGFPAASEGRQRFRHDRPVTNIVAAAAYGFVTHANSPVAIVFYNRRRRHHHHRRILYCHCLRLWSTTTTARCCIVLSPEHGVT